MPELLLLLPVWLFIPAVIGLGVLIWGLVKDVKLEARDKREDNEYALARNQKEQEKYEKLEQDLQAKMEEHDEKDRLYQERMEELEEQGAYLKRQLSNEIGDSNDPPKET